MANTEETTAPDVEKVLQDTVAQIRRYGKMAQAGSKAALPIANDILPLVLSLGASVLARLQVLDDAVADMNDNQESFVRPELAEQINAVFAKGREMAAWLEGIAEAETDEIKKKKSTQVAAEFRKMAAEATAELESVTATYEDENAAAQDLDEEADAIAEGEDEDDLDEALDEADANAKEGA